jgi:hypothetical protein
MHDLLLGRLRRLPRFHTVQRGVQSSRSEVLDTGDESDVCGYGGGDVVDCGAGELIFIYLRREEERGVGKRGIGKGRYMLTRNSGSYKRILVQKRIRMR